MNEKPDNEQKESEEPLEDLTPETDPKGGGPHVRVLRGLSGNPAPDAQKKEISE